MGNSTSLRVVDRVRLGGLIERERARYASEHLRSQELFQRAHASLLAGVPMVWMTMWSGGFPLFFDEAHGNRVTDVDGHTYIDFCLGDTGSMSGHSPEPVVRAIRERVEKSGGLTVMLPTEDSLIVAEELQSRFGLPFWQLGLSATDANRNVLRICRQVQKRPFVLVFSHCYHGTVDETGLVLGRDGEPVAKPGNPGAGRGSDHDVQGGRIQRHRGFARRSERARRCLCAYGARDDQYGHRVATTGIPGAGADSL